jgi:hypothetical protein
MRKLLFGLSWQTIVGAVVLWNLLNVTAIWLNGGWGTYREPAALFFLAGTCAFFAFGSLGIAFSAALQGLALAPSRRHEFSRIPFVALGVFLAGFAVTLLSVGLRYARGGGA